MAIIPPCLIKVSSLIVPSCIRWSFHVSFGLRGNMSGNVETEEAFHQPQKSLEE